MVYPFQSPERVTARAQIRQIYVQARAAFIRETAIADTFEHSWDIPRAWRAHELAHVIGQPYLGLHLRSHWHMLGLAWRSRNTTEWIAQAMRLILTPLAHLTGRIPPNNAGTGRMGLIDHASCPPELDHKTLERI